jgi:hypothetical protein
MRIIAAALVVAVGATSAAYGQSDDVISLWADANMISCEIVDPGSGLLQVHMFHVGSQPAFAVEFFAPTPQCWEGATWLGDVVPSPFLKGGVSTHAVGIHINYLACLQPPVYLGYMNYVVSGGAQPCCPYPVLPQTIAGQITVVACNYTSRIGSGGTSIVNANATCRCPAPIAAETSTWGRVKALYR